MSRVQNAGRRERAPVGGDLAAEIEAISAMTIDQLRDLWRTKHRVVPPSALTKDLLLRALCYKIQEERLGGLDRSLKHLLAQVARSGASPAPRIKVGSVIVREHQGRVHEVIVTPDGFLWAGETYASLSMIARKITGANWNGPRFFGLRGRVGQPGARGVSRRKALPTGTRSQSPFTGSRPARRHSHQSRPSHEGGLHAEGAALRHLYAQVDGS